ncbi:MAG: hypothetical protein WCZ90_16375 [Melioribacteraceae bacterium]
MNFTEKEILEIIDNCEKELKDMARIKFSRTWNWSDNFPKKAGVYAIFYKDILVYVGETANLKERMKEVKRTVNHSFRKKLGKFLNPKAKIMNGKYPQELEEQLNIEFKNNIEFTFKEINFGRIEIENHLMQRNEGVLNSIGKRSKINA